mgnify:CR=1 FL=1
MSLTTKIEVELKEDRFLEGNEICIFPKYILVSSELYEIFSVLENRQDKINNLLNKATEINEEEYLTRKMGLLPGQQHSNNLAKHGRRKSTSYNRRVKF